MDGACQLEVKIEGLVVLILFMMASPLIRVNAVVAIWRSCVHHRSMIGTMRAMMGIKLKGGRYKKISSWLRMDIIRRCVKLVCYP